MIQPPVSPAIIDQPDAKFPFVCSIYLPRITSVFHQSREEGQGFHIRFLGGSPYA